VALRPHLAAGLPFSLTPELWRNLDICARTWRRTFRVQTGDFQPDGTGRDSLTCGNIWTHVQQFDCPGQLM